jgi:hypothetical protein
MGSQKCGIVGKSQPVLSMINPMIFTRTRILCALAAGRTGTGHLSHTHARDTVHTWRGGGGGGGGAVRAGGAKPASSRLSGSWRHAACSEAALTCGRSVELRSGASKPSSMYLLRHTRLTISIGIAKHRQISVNPEFRSWYLCHVT